MASDARLAILLLAATAGAGCDGGPMKTCVQYLITYSGSKPGTAYLRAVEGGGSFSMNAPSMADLIAVNNTSQHCFTRIESDDIPYTAMAWIDVAGAVTSACADPSVQNPDCQPRVNDPQGRQTASSAMANSHRFTLTSPTFRRFLIRLRLS